MTRPNRQVRLSAKTAGYAATPHRLGPNNLWNKPGFKLPNYIENVTKGLMESGKSREEAIPIAIGTIRRWAAGGGNVHPEVRAASAAAIAEWEALKARAKSVKSVKASADRCRGRLNLTGPKGYIHGWIKVGDLGAGDKFKTKSGKVATVTAAVHKPGKSTVVAHVEGVAGPVHQEIPPDHQVEVVHKAPHAAAARKYNGISAENHAAARAQADARAQAAERDKPKPVGSKVRTSGGRVGVVRSHGQRMGKAGSNVAFKDGGYTTFYQHRELTQLSRAAVGHLTLAAAWDPSKHPRIGAGNTGGGQFTTAQESAGGDPRDPQAAQAQQNGQAHTQFDALKGMTPEQRQKFLASLTPQQLAALTAFGYSAKTSDPTVVAARVALAGEVSKRGGKVGTFTGGYTGGGKGAGSGGKGTGKGTGKGAGGSSKGEGSGGSKGSGGGSKSGGSKKSGGGSKSGGSGKKSSGGSSKGSSSKGSGKSSGGSKSGGSGKSSGSGKATTTTTTSTTGSSSTTTTVTKNPDGSTRKTVVKKTPTGTTTTTTVTNTTSSSSGGATGSTSTSKTTGGTRAGSSRTSRPVNAPGRSFSRATPGTTTVTTRSTGAPVDTSPTSSGVTSTGGVTRTPVITIKRKKRRANMSAVARAHVLQLAAAKDPGVAVKRRLAAKGIALPDGSYRIPNTDFLHRAITAYGRAPENKRPQVVAHIRKHARRLNHMSCPKVQSFLSQHGGTSK